VSDTEPTPVSARQPSNAPQESASVVERDPLPLEDAVRALLVLVHEHRTPGDSDLNAAIADVEASL
jgi:hypothetical protein